MSVSAQNTIISGRIFDGKSLHSIPFATAVVMTTNQKYGVYADSVGRFKLVISGKPLQLVISCLGYEEKTINEKFPTQSEAFYLEPKDYKIDEVVVTNKKEKTIGHLTRGPFEEQTILRNGLEFATYVSGNNLYGSIIKEILYRVQSKGGQTDVFRPHLYKSQPSSAGPVPGEELLPEDLTVFVDKKDSSSWFRISVLKYNLKIPKEGLFIGYEYLGRYNDVYQQIIIPSNNYRGILSRKVLTQGISFHRYKLKENVWEREEPYRSYLFGLIIYP